MNYTERKGRKIMFKIMFRRSSAHQFETFGSNSSNRWYLARDAAMYADAISGFVLNSQVCDEATGRVVYDAMSGEWLDKEVS